MKKTRKPIGRWIGEALLIFLSVLGAFYFDNLREGKNQKQKFIQHLEDFRSDLNANLGKFNYELSTQYNPENAQGYIIGTIDRLDLLHSLMLDRTTASADSVLKLIEDRSITGLTKWIFISPQYDNLTNEYYSFIKNDTFKNELHLHYRNNLSRIKQKDDINKYVADFHKIEDQLDLSQGASKNNREILFSNVSINTMRRIKENYETLKNITQQTKTNDSTLLIRVEKELGIK